MQNGFLTANYKCVTGIVATLKPYDGRCSLGKQVDELALSFVAPLGADNDHVFAHD